MPSQDQIQFQQEGQLQRLAQQVAALHTEMAELQDELQGKNAEIERLSTSLEAAEKSQLAAAQTQQGMVPISMAQAKIADANAKVTFSYQTYTSHPAGVILVFILLFSLACSYFSISSDKPTPRRVQEEIG